MAQSGRSPRPSHAPPAQTRSPRCSRATDNRSGNAATCFRSALTHTTLQPTTTPSSRPPGPCDKATVGACRPGKNNGACVRQFKSTRDLKTARCRAVLWNRPELSSRHFRGPVVINLRRVAPLPYQMRCPLLVCTPARERFGVAHSHAHWPGRTCTCAGKRQGGCRVPACATAGQRTRHRQVARRDAGGHGLCTRPPATCAICAT